MMIPKKSLLDDHDKDKADNPQSDSNGIGLRDLTNEVEKLIRDDQSMTNPKVLADETFKKYEYLKITESTPIPEPVPVVKINGEVISTEGYITTISGASKTGKTAAVNVIIAGTIASGEYDGFPAFVVEPAKGKAVLHLDTEQARHNHQKNTRGILKRARIDHCPDNLLSYNIRQLPIDQYNTIVEELCQAAEIKFKGIHLIVIDGIADFIQDPNDPDQSNQIVKFFEELAIKYSTPIIVIIHVNPGSDKERGHLGSQLQRKCESVLSVKVQDDNSTIEAKWLRNAGRGNIPAVQFAYDTTKGYHVYRGVQKEATQSEKDLKRLGELREIVNIVFAPPEVIGYKEALKRIMKHTKRKEATVKGMFRDMNTHDMIIKDGKNWKLNEENE